jgi:hypothetical protein
MYATDITLATNTYSLKTQNPNNSIRSDASQPVSEPNTLTISHEYAKSGKQSSVVIFDDKKLVSLPGATVPVADQVRTMFKIQFNPLAGRTDIEAVITQQVAELTAFLADSGNIDKLMNGES